jgi:hypothetical protein
MKIMTVIADDGSPKKMWLLLCGEVEDEWGLMCAMSNLISHQGKLADYYLNESESIIHFAWFCASKRSRVQVLRPNVLTECCTPYKRGYSIEETKHPRSSLFEKSPHT